MINKLLESYPQLFLTPTLIGACLTNMSNNGCIIIMSNKNLPTCLSVCLSIHPVSTVFCKVSFKQTSMSYQTRNNLTKLGMSWLGRVWVDQTTGTSWPKKGTCWLRYHHRTSWLGYELTSYQPQCLAKNSTLVWFAERKLYLKQLI